MWLDRMAQARYIRAIRARGQLEDGKTCSSRENTRGCPVCDHHTHVAPFGMRVRRTSASSSTGTGGMGMAIRVAAKAASIPGSSTSCGGVLTDAQRDTDTDAAASASLASAADVAWGLRFGAGPSTCVRVACPRFPECAVRVADSPKAAALRRQAETRSSSRDMALVCVDL